MGEDARSIVFMKFESRGLSALWKNRLGSLHRMHDEGKGDPHEAEHGSRCGRLREIWTISPMPLATVWN
jgi:hypothetical protein